MAITLDPAKAQRIKTISGDKVGFWCGAIDAASHRLYAGGTDFNIHAYDLPDGQPGKGGLLKGHGSYVTALAYLPASQTLISGSWDKELIWWKPARGVQPGRRVAVGARINRLAATTDGSLIAVVTDDLVARIYETETAKLRLELQGAHPATTAIGRRNTLYCVAFSPEGKRLATGDRAGTICSWDVATGKPLYRAAAKAFYSQAMSQDKLASEYEWGGVKSLAFSPDAKLLVAGGMGPADQGSAGIDGPMRLEVFDAAPGKRGQVLISCVDSVLKRAPTKVRSFHEPPAKTAASLLGARRRRRSRLWRLVHLLPQRQVGYPRSGRHHPGV